MSDDLTAENQEEEKRKIKPLRESKKPGFYDDLRIPMRFSEETRFLNPACGKMIALKA